VTFTPEDEPDGCLEIAWSGSPSARAIIKSHVGSPAVFDDGQWHQPTGPHEFNGARYIARLSTIK